MTNFKSSQFIKEPNPETLHWTTDECN